MPLHGFYRDVKKIIVPKELTHFMDIHNVVHIWTQNMLFIVNFAKTQLSNKIYICEPLVLYITNTICYHSNKLNVHYLQQT